ncbi:MAG: hypothetical protein MUE37_08305 [Bacteroidales bacterium]|nr:hypothetical protein [Bacteroidales bacterium]
MRESGLYITIAFLMIAVPGNAQNLDNGSRTELTLSDGVSLTLYRTHAFDRDSKVFYYLPVNMHVALRESRPEISFIRYDSDSTRGAILHFLLTWGLSESQEKEANEMLNMVLGDSVYIAGPVLADAGPDSFIISGTDRLVEVMNTSLTQKSRAPVVPGSKMAASFRFSAADLEYTCNIMEKPMSEIDGTLQMIFSYTTMVKEGLISKPVEHEWIIEMNLDDLLKYLRN